MYFAGHSAGAHLATMIATSDWLQLDEEAKNLIKGKINDIQQYTIKQFIKTLKHFLKGYICISGVYDLRPLLRTYVNKPMKMTE